MVHWRNYPNNRRFFSWYYLNGTRCCNEGSDTLIATEKTLAVDAGLDQTICEGNSATLTASAEVQTHLQVQTFQILHQV